MSGVDHKCRQRPAKAIVDTLGKLDPVVGAEQVEVSRVVPLMHDGKAIEQRPQAALGRGLPGAVEHRGGRFLATSSGY